MLLRCKVLLQNRGQHKVWAPNNIKIPMPVELSIILTIRDVLISTSPPPLRSKFLCSCYSDKVFAHVPLLRSRDLLRFAAVVEQSISPRRGDMFIATSLPPLAPFG